MRSAAASPHPYRLAVALGAAATALTFTACAGNPEPRATKTTEQASTKPTPSATPSKTPSPTPSGTVEEQLQAAAQTFYDTLNTSYKTLDTAPFKAISATSCRSCKRYVASIELTKSKGRKPIDVGEYVIDRFVVVNDFSKDKEQASATYQLTYSGLKEVDETGKVVKNVGRQTWPRQAIFHKDGDKWAMVEELSLD